MRHSLVRIVIGLIVVNAAIAVFVLLSGDIGDTEGKILLTSLLATATAVLAMVSAPALASGRLRPVPHLGIAAAVVGFALVTAAIWGDVGALWLGKTAGSAYLIAGASALACLLSAWPIRGRAFWVGTAGYALVATVTLALLAAIWLEIGSSGYWRGFAVLAVLLAAALLAIPILHRSTSPSDVEQITQCPFCGSGVAGVTGKAITCPSCGRRFAVRLD